MKYRLCYRKFGNKIQYGIQKKLFGLFWIRTGGEPFLCEVEARKYLKFLRAENGIKQEPWKCLEGGCHENG